jgi:hypothetical protein
MVEVVEFLWWLVRAGFGIPLEQHERERFYPWRHQVTRASKA